jgi:hypothetical protein
VATIGSQVLIRVVPRTQYDFSGLRNGVVRIPIAQHIDVLGFQRATLQVRIYSGTLPAKSRLQIHLADDGFSADDTTNAFLQTTTASGEEIGTLQLGEGTVFPFYQSISTAVPGVIGRMMAVMVSLTGGADGGPSVVMSLDLVLTGGSVGSTIHQPSTYLGYAHDHVEPLEKLERLSFDQPDQPRAIGIGGREEDLVTRLVTAIRDALLRTNPNVATPDAGYPRFGNVNVRVAGKLLEGLGQPVGREDTLAAQLSDVIRDVVLRDNLNLDTPDGGYARFGNVNVGIGARPFEQRTREGALTRKLYTAIHDALVRGNLDVATPDGGYARFGNVNIGIEANPQAPTVADAATIAQPERGTKAED